jgi:large subunit ribosomal protein L15
VKLLARGKDELKTPINILVSRASAAAIEAVEAAGGKITTRYYTKHSIRRLLRGESESSFLPLGMDSAPEATAESESPILSAVRGFKYRLPDPTSRKDIEYYRDPAHRGYLSHLVEEGQGPSLFFKVPGTGAARKKKVVKAGGMAKGENRLW